MFRLRVLQLAAIAIVVAASTHTTFDLDRFLVPKELVLHLAAVITGLLSIRTITITKRDLLLLIFLALSAVSAVFATNHWLAFRAVAISASAAVLFFVARSLREAGLARQLLNALAFAIVLAAVSSLLQAYGVWLHIFTENRAPGGTLGNRNFVAHAAAFGYPLVLLALVSARRAVGVFFAGAGVTIVTAALVLTRSRAAWLAFGVMLLMFIARSLAWRRLALGVVFAGAGVAAALLIPNTLRWRSDNPYLETAKSVANYQEGSGRGRLIQYQHSLAMAARHPLFGVGPGNWPVEYPDHAARHDPSLDQSESGVTANPWPSSDWVAFVAERGFATAIVLGLFFLGLMRASLRAEDRLAAAAMLAMVVAAGVAGAFDAVLLLPLPAFFVFVTCGAAGFRESSSLQVVESSSGATILDDSTTRRLDDSRPAGGVLFTLLVAVAAAGAFRSGAQLTAMELLTRGETTRAAQIDPGSYRARLRLARGGPRKQRCVHARAVRAMYPHSGAARAAARGCD